MAGYVDRYTPSDPYPRSLLGLAFASVPQTVFLFALIVGINLSVYNEVLQGVSALVLLTLFVGFVLSTHVAQILFRDIARRTDTAVDSAPTADESFRRLASAGVAAAVGLPALVYGVFVALLDWGVQVSLYAGEAAAFGVLFVGVLSLYFAQRTARNVAEQAGEADRETESNGSVTDQPATDPIKTLKHRYAKGELSETEFERKLESLIEPAERTSGPEPETEPEAGSEIGGSLVETE